MGRLVLGSSGSGRQLVTGHADRFVEIAQRVLRHQVIPVAAQNQADREIVFRCLDLLVHGGEIEIELTGIFRLEGAALQLDDHIAMQLQMVEKQINVKILLANLQMILPPHEGKALAKLEHEAGQVLDQGIFYGPFPGLLTQAQEVEDIRVFQALAGQVGIRNRQTLIEIVDAGLLGLALEQAAFDP